MHMVFLFLWHMDCRRGISILLCLASVYTTSIYYSLSDVLGEQKRQEAERSACGRSHRACSVAWLAEHTTKAARSLRSSSLMLPFFSDVRSSSTYAYEALVSHVTALRSHQ